MAKTKHTVAALPEVNQRDLRKERARVEGRHVELLHTKGSVKKLMDRFNGQQLSGKVTNSWMGADEWWLEIELHQVRRWKPGNIGHDTVQLSRSSVHFTPCPLNICQP